MTQNVVTYTVEVITDNSDGKLLPYLTANVRFMVNERKNVLLVPNAALRWKPPQSRSAGIVRSAAKRARRPRRTAQVQPRIRPGRTGPGHRLGARGTPVKPVPVQARCERRQPDRSGERRAEGRHTGRGGRRAAGGRQPAPASQPLHPAILAGGAGTRAADRRSRERVPSLQDCRQRSSWNFIELRDIAKTYRLGEIDLPVLEDISLTINRGEFVALMGASGSGKTTLMNILGCLDRPSSGQYWLDGQDMVALSADERALLRNQKIGFVFQTFNLLPRTSALENVLMPLTYTPSPLSEQEARQRAEALLQRVGLGDRLDHRAVAALRRPAAAGGHRPGADQQARPAVRR